MRAIGLELADIFRQAGPRFREDHADALSRGQRRVMSAVAPPLSADTSSSVTPAVTGALPSTVAAIGTARSVSPWCVRSGWMIATPISCLRIISTSSLPCQRRSRRSRIRTRPWSMTSCSMQPPRPCATIAADPKHLGAEIGFIAILHTWGQNLLHHPHLHCVVPGGGLSADGERWISCRPGFFLPVRVLSRLFRRLFLAQLQAAFDAGHLRFFNTLEPLQVPRTFAHYLAPARKAEWVVYAKPPFGGPQHVLEYLGRYTHRVAISNNRLLDFGDGQVRFRWKDYRHESRPKVMCLDDQEFIRRFLLHVLPDGFQRIRHYGFLANRHRAAKLVLCRQLLAEPTPVVEIPDVPIDYRDHYQLLTGRSLRDCPKCGRGHMLCIETFLPCTLPRGPPRHD